MSALTMDATDVAEVVRVEVERLRAMTSDAARWACERWWVKRLLATTSHPGSVQHRIACGVVDSLAPARVAAHLRAGPPRRDDAA